MAKTKSAMALTVLVMCTTLVFFSPLSSNAQITSASSTIEKCPLYVFGDSLYDTGMALYVNKGPAADAYPYGETYFKKPAGRFSDGRLIPDFIAQFANLPFPEPYLKPGFNDYAKAVNFANAAAGVLVDGRANTLNLKLQTDYFVEMVGKMKELYGDERAEKLVKRAVLIFNIGSNDYVDLWNQNPKPLDPTLVNSFVNKIIGNFTTAITRMYNTGARKFAFQNYGPIGCLPAFLRADGTCSQTLSDLAIVHNDRFAEMAKTWARQFPGFKYIIYDFYTSLSARVANGEKYGFAQVQTACCGSGPFNGKFTCMEKANFTLCSEPSKHLWFDAGHPTEKGHLQFAQEFWGGAPNVVTPRNLRSLFDKQSSG